MDTLPYHIYLIIFIAAKEYIKLTTKIAPGLLIGDKELIVKLTLVS